MNARFIFGNRTSCFTQVLLSWLLIVQTGDCSEVKYWSESHSLGIQPYQTEIIEEALNLSRDKFGPYSLSIETRLFSSQRSKVETEKGHAINLMFTSEWEGSHVEADKIEKIHHPFLKGSLGFRSCIIHKNQLSRFNDIKTEESAKRITLVQGKDWLDTDIYQSAGYQVTTVDSFSSMLYMIERNRVDCFPLSVLEVDAVLHHYKKEFPNLTTAPNFYFFYPLRVYLAIPKTEPLLLQRMRYGINRLSASGKIDKLYNQYYGKQHINLGKKEARLFILFNPYLTSEINHQYIDEFKKHAKLAN